MSTDKLPGAAPVDAQVRVQALDPSQSFIVQAPAGSGKTELLTRRVLTLLTLVDEPEEILAITFTRKAASEMRSRVVDAIHAATAASPPDDPYAKQGYLLARAVLKRDEERQWNLLQNPQRLNLRTIDALCTVFAHRLPVMSQLGAAAGIVEDARPLYKLAAARLLDAQADKLDLVLFQLGNRMQQAQNLLAELLANRDQWRRYVYQDMSTDELREVLESMLFDLVESRLQALCVAIPDDLVRELVGVMTVSAAHRNLLQAAGENVKGAPESLQTLSVVPGSEVADVVVWEAIADTVLVARAAKPVGVRKSVTRANGFPTSKKDAELIGVDMSVLKSIKEQMVELLDRLRDNEGAVRLLNEVRTLPGAGYRDSDWALLVQLLGMLPELLIELQLLFAERGAVDFLEMSLRAQQALGTAEAPTDLALSMDLKIKHILVDEFQDTSRTQFELYKKLVAGWEPDDGRTFFAVGDPMQSIYRFRDGDVTLFAQAINEGIADVALHPLQLTVNFRAAPVVVDWVNGAFESIFPESADPHTGAVPYANSHAHLQSTGHVQLHATIDSDAAAEAATVATLVADALQKPDKNGQRGKHSIAILLRSRGQAAAIFVALQAQGIKYQSIDMELLGTRPVVRDILSLCLALRYPHDRLHWLSVLRAPWTGLTLTDLHALMQDSKHDTVMDLLHDQDRIDSLSENGQQRIAKLLSVIEPAVANAARTALMPWVEACWLQLGGPTICTDRVDLDAAERCIKRLQQLEQAGQLWQASVLHDSMAMLYAASNDGDDVQVQVMTLHKSKGLEFDTVILPALSSAPRSGSQQLLNWFESGSDLDTQLLLAPITERGVSSNDADRINQLVQQARRRCEDQEKLRLLYVACTRARSNLHLLARIKHKANGELATPPSGSLLHPLWPQFILDTHISAQLAAHTELLDTHKSDLTATQPQDKDTAPVLDTHELSQHTPEPPPLRRLRDSWQLPVLPHYQWPEGQKPTDQDVPDVEFMWAGTSARDVGTVVHQQLQSLAVLDEEARDSHLASADGIVERQLKNVGVSDQNVGVQKEQVMRALRNTVDDERGRWILDSAHQQARSEWALSAVGDDGLQRIVIDRTFIDAEGTRWIIDYKTGDHTGGNADAFLDREQERYADQLNRYADIIARMEKRPIKVGLYFPMLKGWREFAPAGPVQKPAPATNPVQGELGFDL